MAKATIAQALTEIFGSDVRSGSDDINLIDVVCQEDNYSAEQIEAARQIAATHDWKFTVARRGRWLSLEGPTVKPAKKFDGDIYDLMSR